MFTVIRIINTIFVIYSTKKASALNIEDWEIVIVCICITEWAKTKSISTTWTDKSSNAVKHNKVSSRYE